MFYRAIGLMSGSSLDGVDLVFAEFNEQGGNWSFEIKQGACYSYDQKWKDRLANARTFSALDYQVLHAEYGRYTGELVNRFIDEFQLYHQVQLVVSHGHTVFHSPAQKITAQLGDGAAIAAVTGLNVVSDLRAMDVALGGQGAPIIPIGEKLLFKDYIYFLNLGGIANLSAHLNHQIIAFDVCPANRVLNMLTQLESIEYDDGGNMAARGSVNEKLLVQLDSLEYYSMPYPKSLSNEFGTELVFPMIAESRLDTCDALATCCHHISRQIAASLKPLVEQGGSGQLLITGGGAHNHFLVSEIENQLRPMGIEIKVPDAQIVDFKEALVMALIGVLRWRQENNVLAESTGASRSSVGGALWNGT
ncbi:MAG TPA: anhydro-N-acetylmuramic acid kinase [Parasegetibacter sp.]